MQGPRNPEWQGAAKRTIAKLRLTLPPRQRIAENQIMRNTRTARGFQMIGALLLLAGLVGRASSTDTTDVPGGPTMTVAVGEVTFELVRIPAGRFLMGSTTGDPDEAPVHEVRIGRAFYLGRTEVTVRQFRAFVEASGLPRGRAGGPGCDARSGRAAGPLAPCAARRVLVQPDPATVALISGSLPESLLPARHRFSDCP